MFSLHNIKPLSKKRKRIGRGGKLGGTSTRGFGGQKARTGDSNVRIGFEGGQMPLYRRLPKRGFNNKRFKKVIEIINLQQLDNFFDADASITTSVLMERGLIKPRKDALVLVKILGKGTLSKRLNVHADAFSQSAREAIESQGGKAHVNKESVAHGTAE